MLQLKGLVRIMGKFTRPHSQKFVNTERFEQEADIGFGYTRSRQVLGVDVPSKLYIHAILSGSGKAGEGDRRATVTLNTAELTALHKFIGDMLHEEERRRERFTEIKATCFAEDLDGNCVGTLPRGTKVTVLALGVGDMVKIQVDDKVCYIHESFI